MNEYPKIERAGEHIEIIIFPFDKNIKNFNIDLILDLNQFGDVVGIEIINLKLEAGTLCLNQIQKTISTMGENIRYSYDDENDCFYLQLSNEPSFYQKAIEGLLVLNNDEEIIGFKIDL